MAAASYRTLEVTLISAKDLKSVNFLSKMEVYAVISLSGDPRTKQRTPTNRDGHKNPTWNQTLRFSVPDSADRGGLVLQIQLRCERALGDRDVGEVHIPLRELEGGEEKSSSTRFLSYQVRRPSGKSKGVLNISYKFGDPVAAPAPPPPPVGYAAPPPAAYPPPQGYPPPPSSASSKSDEPVTAYPAGPSAAYTPQPAKAGAAAPYPAPGPGYPQYPPPAQGYGYPAPAYGYPPPQAGYGGYGAQPVAQPQKKKNKFGMGLGAGLLGGALGGLLIGDMISDAGGYDGGYDCGFDGGGGFDF